MRRMSKVHYILVVAIILLIVFAFLWQAVGITFLALES